MKIIRFKVKNILGGIKSGLDIIKEKIIEFDYMVMENI